MPSPSRRTDSELPVMRNPHAGEPFTTPDAEIADALGKMVPFPPRLGRPSEFASLVRQIVENVMLNGEVIRLDAGVRLRAR